MANDDANGGFLSKVAKFVRHPTTSWSELDTRAADRESEYSKAALKEMIERKRRNDFVRRREFDMLRKIRSREVTGAEGPGVRPSFFQSSLPSKPDDRAMTLKKIDEIEAQMSMQWWKTKGQEAGGAPGAGAGGTDKPREPAPSAEALAQERRLKAQYKETEPAQFMREDGVVSVRKPINPPDEDDSDAKRAAAEDQRDGGDFSDSDNAIDDYAAVDSMPPSEPAAPSVIGLMAPKPSAEGAKDESFSASHFYSLGVEDFVLGPEVEEASIRFANGDDAGAEQGLLEVLGEGGHKSGHVDDWLALFDLYRATGQLAPFESHAVDFVTRFGRSAPQWFDMPQLIASMTGKSFAHAAGPVRAAWVADDEVDAYSVGTLQNVLGRVPQPWVLDWTTVQAIDQKAARALLALFTLWGDQELDLRFQGAPQLRSFLQSKTPSGRRDVEQLWWELRMSALRVMNRPDEFELTALDFCVTYEVSPPGWEKPTCRCTSLSEDTSDESSSMLGEVSFEQVSSLYPNDSAIDSHNSEFNQVGLVELSGEIRGDPQHTLDELEKRLAGTDVLIISCRNLIRVDFSAAGTLLNWVSAHHADGRLVQFVDAHRLVAAFFQVIGITEHAKVVVRVD